MPIGQLTFRPLFGASSPHLQTVIASLLSPGMAPPSREWRVDLEGGDQLSCQISTPPLWKKEDPTIVLVHGMGGSHSSGYGVRMARKFYEGGRKVVRVNLRGCGSGAGLSKKPYCAGSSGDVRKVLQDLKLEAPRSEIVLIGFSLGGNIALKLAGEMGSDAEKWVKRFIAVSAPLDLFQSVKKIQENPIYHFYYLNRIKSQAKRWNPHKIRSLYEFDDQITAPLSGYGCAREYYQECSSIRFLPNIRQSARLLFAEDDPFISLDPIRDVLLPEEVEVAVTKRGGHMGFLGSGFKEKSLYWMDEQLLLWSQ